MAIFTATGSEILSDKHDGTHGYSVSISREKVVLAGPTTGALPATLLKEAAFMVNVNAPVNYSDSVAGMLYAPQGSIAGTTYPTTTLPV